MKVEQIKEELIKEWQDLRTAIDKAFYYLEEEDFQRKGSNKDSWTVAETLYHINILNRHFLDQLENRPQLKGKPKSSLPKSLYAKMLLASMPAETHGVSKRKYKTPSATDPLKKQAKGYAIVPKVVFADLLADLDQIKSLIAELDQGNLATYKIKGVIKVFRIYTYEALLVLIRHSHRHIIQAENIIKGN